MATYLYISPKGSVADVSSVTIRKFPVVIVPTPTGDAVKDAAALAQAEADAAGKAKPARFVMKDINGQPVRYQRYNVSVDTARAYMAESDAKKRGALLAGITPADLASPISPTAAHLALMSATFTRDELAAQWSAGILVVPSTRASAAAETKRAQSSMTADERRASVLDSLFPAAPAEGTDTDNGEGAVEPSEPDGTDNGTEPTETVA